VFGAWIAQSTTAIRICVRFSILTLMSMLSLLLLCLAITACVGSKDSIQPQANITHESGSSTQESSSSGSNQNEIDKLGKLSDGSKNFKTIEIGKQIWMKENLNIDINGSVCYKNDPANCKKYGRLYDWHTALKACPNGWHLATNKEWEELFRYVDGTPCKNPPCNDPYISPYISKVAGKYLKAASGWSYGGNGTDEFGFSALPGGFGFSDGYFSNANDLGYWWSAYEGSDEAAFYFYMDYYYDMARHGYGSKLYLFSVRCVKD